MILSHAFLLDFWIPVKDIVNQNGCAYESHTNTEVEKSLCQTVRRNHSKLLNSLIISILNVYKVS